MLKWFPERRRTRMKWYKGAQRKLSVKEDDEMMLKVRLIASILDKSLEQEKEAKDMYIA